MESCSTQKEIVGMRDLEVGVSRSVISKSKSCCLLLFVHVLLCLASPCLG